MPRARNTFEGDIIVTAQADVNDLLSGETLLLEVAGEIDNLDHTVMRAARRIAIEDMAERFDTETTPDQDPFVSLDPDYRNRKLSAGFPDKILTRTSKTKDAALAPESWNIIDNTLFFDTSYLPASDDGIIYGLLHQEGTGDPSNWGLRARVESGGYTDAQKAEYKSSDGTFGIGSGNALPARPWVGMSEVAEARLWDLFNRWFEELGNAVGGERFPFAHPGGTIQKRSASGQFGPSLL